VLQQRPLALGIEHVNDADVKPHHLERLLERLFQEFGKREGGRRDADHLVEHHELLVPDADLLFRAFALGDIHHAGNRAPELAGIIGERGRDHQRGDAAAVFADELALVLLPGAVAPATQALLHRGAARGLKERVEGLSHHLFRGIAEHLRHPGVDKRRAGVTVDHPYSFAEALHDQPVLLFALSERLLRTLPAGDVEHPGKTPRKCAGGIDDRRRDHERVDPPAAAVEEVQLELLPPVGLPAERVFRGRKGGAGGIEEPGDR